MPEKGGMLLGSFNLNEPQSECEPQTLSESLLDKILLSYFEVETYRIARQSENGDQYRNMYEKRFAEGQDRLKPCYLWVRAVKK